MELKDIREAIEGKLNDITLDISNGTKNAIVYSRICEVLELIKSSSSAGFFNIDMVDISDEAKLMEPEREAVERKRLKAEALGSFLKEKVHKDKVNIFFVFGACNTPSSPHSNLLIAVGDELYSVDPSPMSNSIPKILKELGYDKVFTNGVYYNDKKNRDSFTGLQTVASTCVKKSILTIINILEILKDFDIANSEDSMKKFFKDGLVEYTGERLSDVPFLNLSQKDSEEERFNKKFFYNPLYSMLESDILDDLSERVFKYLFEEKRLLEGAATLERVRETVSKFPEFDSESMEYEDVVDAKLKKNYLTRVSEDLEFAKMVNDRITDLMSRRQSNVEEEFVCSSTPDFFDIAPHLFGNDNGIEPKCLVGAIERGKSDQSDTELSEIGRKSNGRY